MMRIKEKQNFEGFQSVSNNTDLTVLQQKAGCLGKLKAGFATRKKAGNALQIVQEELVNAEKNIALTGLKLAEAAIRTSLVGNAMPALGALTTRVNAATASVDQALTNGAMAETFTHMNNRSNSINLAKELNDCGKISKDECEILTSLSHSDAENDILRTRERMASAKEVVSKLHDFAIVDIGAGIEKII